MSIPSLNIPIKVNLDDFRKGMSEASSSVSKASDFIAKEFMKMNIGAAKVIAPPAFSAIGAALPPLVSAFGPMIARLAAFKAGIDLVTVAIGAARSQITEMVAIADKASLLTVTPAFFQSFLSESHGLKVSTEELEGALTHAFNATKEKSPIDLAAWETGKDRITVVESALRIYNETLAKSAGTQLQGLVLFRDADSQEKKVKAVLLAMVQLKDIGQETAALDIGEKMFGSQFVDRIRQGKTSAESILLSMKAAAAADDGIFSNTMVMRAKQVDDQLKLSHDRLTRGLKPSWDDLTGTLLTIKGYWADVVDLIGKAVDFTNRLGLTSEKVRIRSELDSVNEAVKNGTGLFGLPQVPESVTSALGMQSPQTRLRERQQRLQAQLDAMDRGMAEGPDLPKASRGTGEAPKFKPTDSTAARDPFDITVDAVNKRIAALNAETATIGQGSDARARAATVAQLEAAAKRANTAAGLENTAVTAKQRAEIDKEADAMLRAAAAAEKAQVGDGIKFGRNTSLLTSDDVQIATQLRGLYPDVATALDSVEASAMRTNEAMRGISGTLSSGLAAGLTDIATHSKTVGQSFSEMSTIAIRAIEEMIIKIAIVAPIMRALQGGFGGFSTGGLVSVLPLPGAGDFIGPVMRADGGVINGPGTGTSDSIPARLSDGEFVVNARATAQNRSLLELINSGRMKGFAAGGLASNLPSTPDSSAMIGGQTVHVAPTINVSVAGGSRGAQADAAMGEQIAKAVEDSVRGIVASELRTQSRPGGV
ncbi:hypothetical protein, partial [Rhodopseudomonas palustris]|uniref:hypothetical protein n=2 Tax=Rhodopseudomonas TaxID=1073 RepID=UPI000695EB25